MSLNECLKDPVFTEWYNSRPLNIQKMVEATPPNQLYEMKDAGACKTVYEVQAYNEDGTVTAARVPEHSALPFDYDVFGIDPNNLVVAVITSED